MMLFLLFLIISKINTPCNNDQLLTEAVAGQKKKCLAQGHRTVPRTSDPLISKVTPYTTTEQTGLIWRYACSHCICVRRVVL